jgi:hypothetical protein
MEWNGMDKPLMIFLILQKEGRREGGSEVGNGMEWTNL